MKKARNFVPYFGLLALLILFFKLPEAPNIFGLFKCTACLKQDPYLAFLGAGYFALITMASLLFPAFPNRSIARGGQLWAILLFLALTSIDFPAVCIACVLAHLCHIAIWTIWLKAAPLTHEINPSSFRERLCLTFFAPFVVVALFSCMNLTFMIYNLKAKQTGFASNLKPGDKAPQIKLEEGKALSSFSVINFVMPNCAYCQEQLPILEEVLKKASQGSLRCLTITPSITDELRTKCMMSEWFEDKEGKFLSQFQVSGYPTLFIVGSDGKIHEVIAGVPDGLKEQLLAHLPK